MSCCYKHNIVHMIEILQNNEKIEFLTQLSDLIFTTTAEWCQVTLTSVADGKVLYDELLYPFSGRIEVVDLQNILEYHLMSLGVCGSYLVHIEEPEGDVEEFTMRVAYCNADAGKFADFVASNFLSVPNVSIRTTANRQEEIALWKYTESGETDTPSATLRAYYSDNTTQDYSLPLTSYPEEQFGTSAGAGDSAKLFHATIDMNNYVVSGKSLYRVVAMCEDRTREYVVDIYHSEPDPLVYYLNSFGVIECLACYGRKESEPKFERIATTSRGVYRNIMVKETRFWNADTGILTEDERERALEMFRSPHLMLKYQNSEGEDVYDDIAITEQECLYDNSDDNLPRYTFTYRLCQRIQNIMRDKETARIFTEHFTNVYA